jgi:hypothetical protein
LRGCCNRGKSTARPHEWGHGRLRACATAATAAGAATVTVAVALLMLMGTKARAQTPRDIVQRAVAQDHSNAPHIRDFTYRQRQVERQYDSAGKVKQTTVRTWEISFVEGSPYRRLVARNDQPLSADEQKFEEDRMRYAAEQRRKESKAEREKRVGEWQRRQQKQREPVMEVPDAFAFTMAGEEAVDGAAVYVIDATPKPGYKPKSSTGAYLPKMKARFWIAKKDFQWLKMEAETLDTITFGGILVRLAKGSNLEMEQGRVDEEICLPKHFVIRASARVALFKLYKTDIEYTLSDFRKSAVEGPKAGE